MSRTPFLIAAATAGLLVLGASPASAAGRALPVGDALYAIACPYYSTDSGQLPNLQLIELDAATGVGTLVGSGTPALEDADCGGQGAWDAATVTAYAIALSFQNDAPRALVTIDPVSGNSTFVGEFHDAEGTVSVASIAISPDGVAYAAGDSELFRLDLGSALLTPIGDFGDNYTMSFDPTSGVLYNVDSSGVVTTVNTDDASEQPFGQIPATGSIYSFAIDSAGTFWYGVDNSLGNGDYEAQLFSVDPTAFETSALESGFITVGETRPYPEALLLVPPYTVPAAAPVLPATGVASNGVWGLAAGALALLGVTLVALRRRRTV